MDWKFLLITHFLAVIGGGFIVYRWYAKIITAYNDVESGVKYAVDKFHKVKASL